MRVTAISGAQVQRSGDRGHTSRTPFGVDAMMSYHFDRSPIYSAGNVAASWAVAILLFAVLAFA
jgi:hypothetical protein